MNRLQEIDVELAANAKARDALETARYALTRERDSIALSLVDHPWLGKQVQLAETKYGATTKSIKIGTLAAYDPAKHRSVRGIGGYGTRSGDLFVISCTGKSAYRFTRSGPGMHVSNFNWTLVEGQGE